MGSKVKSSNLYWLGRYTELVLITLRYLMDSYDRKGEYSQLTTKK